MPCVTKGMFRLSSCHSSVPIQDRCVNLRAVASLSSTPPPPLRRPMEMGVLKGGSEIDPKSRPPSLLCSRTNGMVGESRHATRWFPGGQWLEKRKCNQEKQTQLQFDVGRVLSTPKLAGQSSRKPGCGAAFQRLGSSLLSPFCKDTDENASASGSCLPEFPNAWPHSFTHSSPLLLRTHLSRPRSGVAGTGDIEMNNTRKAVVKELALWEGRKPNASLEESDRAQRQLGKGQVEGR